jgi:excisionase family DNA binding protein
LEPTYDDLRTGLVSRVKPSWLAKQMHLSLPTVYRQIKAGDITAVKSGERVYIPANIAIELIQGQLYQHDHQDQSAIRRMERARSAKNKSA